MNWEDERYVRVYVRDTTTWKRLNWQGKCLLLLVLRKVDRAGTADVGDDAVEGLAALTDMPLELVQEGLPRLLKSGSVRLDGERLTLPNFLIAQECARSDAERKRKSRELRALGVDPERPVTERDAKSQDVTKPPASRPVTERDEPSQDVTESHEKSQASRIVTPYCAVLNQELHAAAPGAPTHAHAREGLSAGAVALLDALESHPVLRGVATPKLAEHIEAERIPTGKPTSWLVAAIAKAASKAGADNAVDEPQQRATLARFVTGCCRTATEPEPASSRPSRNGKAQSYHGGAVQPSSGANEGWEELAARGNAE